MRVARRVLAPLVYSLLWLHKAEPPGWVNTANLTLLGELHRRAPHAIDWAGIPDVMPVLDAFTAAMDCRMIARRH